MSEHTSDLLPEWKQVDAASVFKKRSVIREAVASVILWLCALSLAWSVSWRLGVAGILGTAAFNLSEWIRNER